MSRRQNSLPGIVGDHTESGCPAQFVFPLRKIILEREFHTFCVVSPSPINCGRWGTHTPTPGSGPNTFMSAMGLKMPPSQGLVSRYPVTGLPPGIPVDQHEGSLRSL